MAAVQLELVSKPYTNAAISFGESLGVQLSGEGKWALITSSADAIPREDSAEPSLDVFLRNIATGDTKLISRGSNGGGGNGPSIGLALSADGRYALFSSDADDLVGDDTNNTTDIFLYDRIQDSLTLVSQKGGVLGDDESTDATMTPDGRFILFQSSATNLGTNDVSEVPDLFLFDRENRSLKTVTEGLLGGQKRPNFDVSMSVDGRYVAFLSAATNGPLFDFHPAIPTGSDPQVYVRDMSSEALYWMTEQADHAPGRFASNVRLSTNGIIAFVSADLELGPASIKPSTYVYWIRINPRLIMRLPRPADIADESPRTVSEMVMTADGQQISYIVDHGSIGLGVPVSRRLYLFDVPTMQHRLLASSTNLYFKNLRISEDGKVISVSQVSTNSDAYQLYRINTTSGTYQLLSRNESSEDANRDVSDPVLSADGSVAAFVSNATNIGSQNPHAEYNVFAIQTEGTEPAFQLSGTWPTATSRTASGASKIPVDPIRTDVRPRSALTIDGSRVVFTSSAWNITPGDTNGRSDIFVRDLTSGKTKRIDILNDRDLNVLGISRDASMLVFENHLLTPLTSRYALHAIDVSSERDLLEGLFPPSPPNFGSATTIAALNDSGQYMLFELRGDPSPDRTFFVRDLVNGFSIPLPVTRLQVTSGGLSSGGKYAILESRNPRESNLAGQNLIIDVATGTTNVLAGLFVASTPDDANILLTTASSFSTAGDLSIFAPVQNISILLATNASFPAMSFDGRTIIFNQQYLPADGGAARTRALAMNRSTGVPFPLGARADGKELRFDETPSVSADGRYVAFAMKRDNGATDSDYLDVYLYDGVVTNLTLLSQTASGALPNGPSRSPTVAANGRVVFESLASDLVPDDHNLDFDIFVATVSATDTDQDGLDDGWEMETFGTLSATASDDLDGDGMSNLQEWLAGTNPKSAVSALRLKADKESGGGILHWASAFGRRYQIQVRQSLSTGEWQDISLPVTALSTNLSAKVERNNGSNSFYRIRLVE